MRFKKAIEPKFENHLNHENDSSGKHVDLRTNKYEI